MDRIRIRKSNYKSIVLVPTELKRRAANYSDCLPGLAAALALEGAADGHQRDWHWLGVVHRGLAVQQRVG